MKFLKVVSLRWGNWIFYKNWKTKEVLFQISDGLDFLSVIDFPLQNVFTNIFLSSTCLTFIINTPLFW